MKREFVSDHSLSNLAVCESKHILSWNKWESKDSAVALRCGTDVHSAMDLWRRGSTAAEVLEAFEGMYRAYSEKEVPADNGRYYTNVVKVLAEYMKRRVRHPWDEVVSIEAGYAAPLYKVVEEDTEYWYLCYPDMVVRRDGRLHTVDTKTTGWLKPDWTNQWDTSTQLTGQQWCVEQVFKEECRDSFVDGIELKAPNSSSKKCPKHGVAYFECAPEHMNFKFHLTHREAFQTADWLQETSRLCGRFSRLHDRVGKFGVRHAAVDGTYTGACVSYGRFCDFYPWCSTGRQEGMLEQLFDVSAFKLADRGKVMGPGMVEVVVPEREAA